MKHMFKNHLLSILVIVLVFTGCQKKTDEIFDKTPDERLADALAAYQKALVGAPNGWKMIVYPKGLEAQDIEVGAFSFYMKFNDANRVTMVSDFDTTTAATPKESGYRLKAVQRPSILFDTYSYIHIPSDPAAAISRTPAGNNGYGWGSDFEFSFADNAPGDTIHLVGNFNNSDAIMIKATAQEAAAYNNKQLSSSIKLLQNLNFIGYFKAMTFGGKQYYITVDEGNKLITFSWLDAAGNVQTYTTGYFSTINGITLLEPFNTGNGIISNINFTTWNAGALTMNVSVNSTNTIISSAGKPLKVNVNLARAWWQFSYDQDNYWFSVFGFTVDGVRDAYKIRSIPNLYYLGYWAWFGTDASVTPAVQYDLLGFIKVNDSFTALELPYGAAYLRPTFTADGRIIFTFYGTFRDVPYAEQTPYVNTASKMLDPNGYYLIQTGDLTFDMVSRDGKSWITWQW
jgi:hypothetical protein